MINVSHITKIYGDHTAVNDISFTAEPGHIYGFLGPNGAGKSTTMNIITGYIGASTGKVTINDHDILLDATLAKKDIGYLPEQPPVYMDMTVLEYLKFCAELKGVSKMSRASAVEEVMEQTKITTMQNRLIKHLSKGYKQRVGLAQALLGNPEVIILDEPSVGLDPEQIIEMRELILSLKKNHTVILSSHILSEVQAVCDYVFIIANGKMVAADTIENLESIFNTNSLEDIFLEITKRKTALNQNTDIFDESAETEEAETQMEIEETEETEVQKEIEENDEQQTEVIEKATEENPVETGLENMTSENKESFNDEKGEEE